MTRVLSLLRRYGDSSTGFQTLEPGFEHAFDGDACIAFVDTGPAIVAAGPPIAAHEERAAIARRFVAATDKRVCFFSVDRRFADDAGLRALLIGEEPEWDPNLWDETLSGARRLREQLRRARAKGVTVRVLELEETREPHPTRARIDRLIGEWLASRPLAAMGFLVDVRPWDHPEERIYLVAERAGDIVGFCAAVPMYAREGWLIEDLLRTRAAPNGTAELLVDRCFREVQARGARVVTMGLAPLAGNVPRILRAIASLTRGLYNFEGVRAFKARLRPQRWVELYLAAPEGQAWSLTIHDVLRAFATGGFVRFGVESLRRQRQVVALVLGVMLIPWMLLLALPAEASWFPSAGVRNAWIALDAFLAIALIALFRRWRAGLATMVAFLTAIDAVLTAVQAVVWDLPRVHTPTAAFAVAIACAAPIVATLFLRLTARFAPLTDRSEPAMDPPAQRATSRNAT